MALKYRTTDLLKWLTGLGRNLTPTEADDNIWQLHSRVDVLETTAIGVGFATDTEGPVSLTGLTLTFRFDDASEQNVTLPTPKPSSVGAWAPDTLYLAMAFVKPPGSNITYIVLRDHTSAASFDPGANDGNGHDYYAPWFDATVSFAGLTDVDLSTDPPDGSFVRIRNTTAGLFLYDDVPTFADLGGQFVPAQYPAGLQPVAQTVSLATDGSLAIDLADGISAHVTLDQDVSAMTITGWPTTGTPGELILRITNAGGFNFLALPSGTHAAGGVIPSITADTAGAGVDKWRFSSDDAGATIDLDVINSNYLPV